MARSWTSATICMTMRLTMFAPLTMRLLPSSCWNLFVKTAQWQEFVTGESNRFEWPPASATAGWLRQREGHGSQHRGHADGRLLAQGWAQHVRITAQAR